ncbi:MAG: patatin-like phospholipase family protein [Spirochaetia bacterium]|nr:patatin-like phospholipase family protein [Spirochaetia bacterium]
MRLLPISVILLCAMLALPAPVTAQPGTSGEESGDRPVVALVLSGGAALGFAHVGALKVIDEIGIPIDMVVGTSMGGLIGGLYALGHTPRDIEQIADRTDWFGLFTAPTSLSNYYFGPIIDSRNHLISLSFDEKGVGKTLGLISDQKIMTMMSELTASLSSIEDFDQFPIPLRMVGVDIISGEVKVFDSGRVIDAMRSTMSIPTLFPPHEIDGHYYIDGGAKNNLPIDVAIDLGADIVIAVDVDTEPYLSIDDLSSPLEVLYRYVTIVVEATEEGKGELADVLIEPDLTGLGLSQFNRYDEFFIRGEEAARSMEAELTVLRDRINKTRSCLPRAYDREGAYDALPPQTYGDIILADEDERFPIELFTRLENGQLSEQTMEQLEILSNRIVSSGRYTSISYRLVPAGGSKRGHDLEIRAIPSLRGRHTFGLGVSMDSGISFALEESGYVVPAVTTSLVFSELFDTYAYVALNAALGSDLSVDLELFAPFGESVYFNPHVKFYEGSFWTPDQQDIPYRSLMLSAEQEFGILLGKFVELGIRVEEQVVWLEQISGSGTTYDTHLALLLGPALSWKTTEHERFLHQGIISSINLDIPLIAGNDWYERFCLAIENHIPVSQNGTFSYDLLLGSYAGGFSAKQLSFDLGGWDGVPGYLPDHQVVDDIAMTGVQYQYRFDSLSEQLGIDIYGLGQARAGVTWEGTPSLEVMDLSYGAALGIGFSSFLGDVVIGAGINQNLEAAYYLLFN